MATGHGYANKPARAQVTLHNVTITCIRALIGQKFIVIVGPTEEKNLAQVSDFKILSFSL
jgi:hypothetical protein